MEQNESTPVTSNKTTEETIDDDDDDDCLYEDIEDGEIIDIDESMSEQYDSIPEHSPSPSKSGKKVMNHVNFTKITNGKIEQNCIGRNPISCSEKLQPANNIKKTIVESNDFPAEVDQFQTPDEQLQTESITNQHIQYFKLADKKAQKITQEINGNLGPVLTAAKEQIRNDCGLHLIHANLANSNAKLKHVTNDMDDLNVAESSLIPTAGCSSTSNEIENLTSQKQSLEVQEVFSDSNLSCTSNQANDDPVQDTEPTEHVSKKCKRKFSSDDEDDDNDFFSGNKKRLYVNLNSMEQMMQPSNDIEYDVIDDLSNDEDYDDSYEWNSAWANSSDSDRNDVPEDEIDAMLDEGLDAYRRNRQQMQGRGDHGIDEDDLSHEEREKVVLKVRGHDHFEILPEGWIEVTHNSGMPVYLHKVSRVCTLSKPYFLGPGSARKHEIPITAIPCLHYRREIEKEQVDDEVPDNTAECDASPPDHGTNTNNCDDSKVSLPSAKIETVFDNNKEKSLDYLHVRKYCQRLFEFQTITVRRFKTWAGRRKHQKLMKQLQRPTLPSGTKLITCPLPPCLEKDETTPVKPRREFTMNPNGKSHVCILHEYVQHAMRVQPKYAFKELENAKKPYGATVLIKEMEYGTGYGSSKKQAKSEAAKATLEILIPQIKDVNSENGSSAVESQDLFFFDEIRIEDPRISELCAKAGQPSPYQILLECLKRNHGMGDTEVKLEMHTLKHQKNEFTMRVSKHEAKVICKNKRDGKQRASQSILQLLHPHITSWGSLLRLYGKGSCKTLKEKKLEEQQITELQSRASANRPNVSILNKLKEEMLKLKENKDAVKPIGKFKPGDVDLPSGSGSNLKNLDL